jgi:hypothetical protein
MPSGSNVPFSDFLLLLILVQEAQCNLNPVSGATQNHPDVDPVSGNEIPLICSNFDAHKINNASFFKF